MRRGSRLRRLCCMSGAVVCALALLPSASDAADGLAAQSPAADFGGGSIPVNPPRKGGSPRTYSVSLRPSADGRRVLVYGTAFGRCRGTPYRLSGGLAFSLPLDAAGGFGGSDVSSYGPRRERRTERIAINGRTEGARASGALRVRITQRRRGRSTLRCDSGLLSWQGRAAAVPPAPAALPSPNALFFGTTATRVGTYAADAFLLRVSTDGRSVGQAYFGVHLSCRRGGRRSKPDVYDNFMPSAPIAADGSFTSDDSFPLGGGSRGRVVVSGRFTTTGVTGTYRATSTYRRRGRVVERCDSGDVAWSAVP